MIGDYLINYDIHWNPVRIIQRFGRIDRIGSRNKVIQLVNFWPDMDLDEYLALKDRVETRMKISVMTATGDENPLTPEEQGDLAAFVCAQNMTLEAYDLGVSSVIVGRAEATFSQPGMQEYLDQWGLDPAYMPIVFVCLGYIDGPYPPVKARNEGRSIYVGWDKKL